MRSVPAKNVDDYIAAQDQDKKERLVRIRSIIRSQVPDAEETISYMIPTYKYHGMLVGFGANKLGTSFYAMSNTILSSYSEELKNFKCEISTVHFPLNKPLPVALIKKIIKERIRQNTERAMRKEQAKIKK